MDDTSRGNASVTASQQAAELWQDASGDRSESPVMSESTSKGSMTDSERLEHLERLWIRFQFDVAGIRGVMGPLYQAAMTARRHHTFYPGDQPEQKFVRAEMRTTPDVPNGVPDGHALSSGDVYGARVASVASASTILITFDTAIQEFAGYLRAGKGANMQAGDRIYDASRSHSEAASTLIWAGANNVRHVDEWHRSAEAYANPVRRGSCDDERCRIARWSRLSACSAAVCLSPRTSRSKSFYS
jgi:hypothetical protein